MEMERVPRAGYAIEGLWISGFQRSLALSNLLFPFKVLSSLWKARGILKRFKPDAVIGVGGYASGPTLKAAGWLGIPTVLHEQNSHAGATNRLLAKRAARICVAYPNMERFFPKDKLVLTGNPVRSDILDLEGKREQALVHYGFSPERPILLVVGGSLGARTLNQSMAAGLDALQQAGIQTIWQTGKGYYETYAPLAEGKPELRILPFLERMDWAYACADAVISRAGALAVSELAVTGKPSILVPSPNVVADHQTANALSLVNQGAALLVRDDQAPQTLIDQAIRLLQDPEARTKLSHAIRALGIADAGDRIAQEIFALLPTKTN